jgi:hypothetical protein
VNAGFSNLVNLSLELLSKCPLLGFSALEAYHHYLVSGCSMGLGRLGMYDRFDSEAIVFFRARAITPIQNKPQRNSIRNE